MAKPVQDRILYAIKSNGPQTAPDIAAVLAVTPQAAQQQLARLAKSGLVSWDDRRQPRGRPRRFWSLTDKGHARFPDRHADLTIDILRSVEQEFGAEGLDRLISRREKEMLADYRVRLADCSDLRQKVERLAQIRANEGYMADCQPLGGGGFLLVENHCPVCAAAALCQGICRSELQLFQAALGKAASVERTDHILAGARRCAYRIMPRTPAA